MVDLGTVSGQIKMNFAQALAAYAAVRAANSATTSSIKSISGTLIGAGARLTAFGAIGVAAFGYAVKAAADFQQQLSHFQAVTGATAGDMELIRTKALQLGRDSAYGASEVAQAFVELGKAGVPAKQIIEGVGDAVVQLAAAGDISLASASTTIVNAIQTFGLKATDAVHVANILAGAANASTVEVQDLAVSLKYAGAIASALHIPIEQVNTALAILGQNGIRGSTAGTSLRQILVSLAPTSKRAAAEMKDLGIITKDGSNLFFDAAGHAKDLGTVFQILKDHTAGLSSEQQIAAYKIIFNNRALAAAVDLSKGGSKAFADMNAQINNVTALDVMHTRLNNLSGSLKIFKSSVQTAFIQMGAPAQKPLKEVVDFLTRLVNAFARLSPATQEWIVRIGLLVTALALMGGGFLLAVGFTMKLINAFREVKEIIAFVRALKLVELAFAAMNVEIEATPLGWILTAVAAAIVALVLLYKNWDTVWKFITDHKWLAGIAFILAPMLVFIIAIVGAIHYLATHWSQVWSGMKNAPEAVWKWLQSTWGTITSFFSNVFKALPGIVSGAISGIGGFFSRMWHDVTGFVSRMFTDVVGFFTRLPGEMGRAASTAVTAVGNFFYNLPYYIGFAIGRTLKILIDFGISAYNWAMKTGSEVVNAVVGFFQRLPGYIATFFSAMLSTIISIGTQIISWVTSMAVRIFNAVVNEVQRLPGQIASIFTSIFNTIVRIGSSVISWVANMAVRIFNAIVNEVRQLPGQVSSAFSSMFNAIVSWGGRMISQAGHIASSIFSALVDGIRNLPNAMGGILDSMVRMLTNLGSRAWDAAKHIGSSLWNGFKKGMGISSPSYIERAMTQVAANVLDTTNDIWGTLSTLKDVKVAVAMGTTWGTTGLLQPTAAQLAAMSPGPGYTTGGTHLSDYTPYTPPAPPVNITVNNPIAEPVSRDVNNSLGRLRMFGASSGYTAPTAIAGSTW